MLGKPSKQQIERATLEHRVDMGVFWFMAIVAAAIIGLSAWMWTRP